MTYRLLDLFCGAGGASMGYYRAGFEVVGVDIKPQPNYPFEFHQADARGFVIEPGRFDAIHASPPCQMFTAYRRRGDGVGDGYPNLIPEMRDKLAATGLPWVIENVATAKTEIHGSALLCGSMFGLDVQRHRLFESNVLMLTPECRHDIWTPRFPKPGNTCELCRSGQRGCRCNKQLRRTVEVGVWRIPVPVQQKAMGIDWMTLPELSESIPPAYTEYLGSQLIEQMEGAA